jgi:hypothetical protein
MNNLTDKKYTTPILFLIFNRPDITHRVFEQIKKIKPSHLFIAADGPRPERPDDLILCQETRNIVEEIDWDCEVKTLFRNENLGCGLAVCSAINWFFEQVEEGIILEDDCMPELSFFDFCSELLGKYKEDDNIFMISGTNMQNGIRRGDASYYFSNYPIIWGWASWRKAWHTYNFDIPDCGQAFKSGKLDDAFQSNDEKKYWRKKIEKLQSEKKKSTWDYQWFYAVWKNKGVTIVPNTNLIINIGFENNSTHTFLSDSRREPSALNPIRFPLIHPTKKINNEADQYTFRNAFSHSISRFYRLIKENGLFAILKYTIRKFV